MGQFDMHFFNVSEQPLTPKVLVGRSNLVWNANFSAGHAGPKMHSPFKSLFQLYKSCSKLWWTTVGSSFAFPWHSHVLQICHPGGQRAWPSRGGGEQGKAGRVKNHCVVSCWHHSSKAGSWKIHIIELMLLRLRLLVVALLLKPQKITNLTLQNTKKRKKPEGKRRDEKQQEDSSRSKMEQEARNTKKTHEEWTRTREGPRRNEKRQEGRRRNKKKQCETRRRNRKDQEETRRNKVQMHVCFWLFWAYGGDSSALQRCPPDPSH